MASFSRRHSLPEASCPARGFRPSCDRPTVPPEAARTRAGFPCSARMRYGWIGCLPGPGGSGARATGCASPGRRLPLSNGPPLSPWTATRPRMSNSRGISKGSLSFTPASLPLACGPRRNGTLGLFPELRTRQGRTLPRTSERGRAMGTARTTSLASASLLRRTHSLRATTRRKTRIGHGADSRRSRPCRPPMVCHKPRSALVPTPPGFIQIDLARQDSFPPPRAPGCRTSGSGRVQGRCYLLGGRPRSPVPVDVAGLEPT